MPKYNQPLSGNDMPRFAGPPTMMRLPAADSDDQALQHVVSRLAV